MAEKEADIPGVVAPPVLIYLVPMGAGFCLDFFLIPLSTGLPGLLLSIVGAVLILLALVLIFPALFDFRRAGTDSRPWKETSAIVATGPYRITRNPMYLGFTLIMLAAGLMLDTLWILMLLPPVLLVMRQGVILREERYLEHKFGQAYLDYKSRVRRWL